MMNEEQREIEELGRLSRMKIPPPRNLAPLVIVDVDENGKEFIVNCNSEFERIMLWSAVEGVNSKRILWTINEILKKSPIIHWFAMYKHDPPRNYLHDPDTFLRLIHRLMRRSNTDMYEKLVIIRKQFILEGHK